MLSLINCSVTDMQIKTGTAHTSEGAVYSESVTMRNMIWFISPVFIGIGITSIAATSNFHWGDILRRDLSDLAIPFTAMFLVLALLWSIKLRWTLSKTEFSFTYFPFVWKTRTFSSSEIESVEIMKINSLLEFGGWGLRYGRLGKAYTTYGNHILHVKLKKGTAINVTVQRPKQAREFLENFIN